ncbi:AfsR/SARP family transcriptional regulator, partial [Micromonospora sp. URMC 107]|uniref:AfsR/SARP family transcriptional regulator n=1 Tax=Micromonospora sp. URMC 107 TaxID=3423418 RepID=UPI003F1B96D6
VVGELTGLVRRYPLRERLRGQLMLALHRSGRTADGLGVYRDGRAVLSTQLGIEPGKELRDLHRAMLGGGTPPTGRPARTGGRAGQAAAPAAPPAPPPSARPVPPWIPSHQPGQLADHLLVAAEVE